jgi:hypothetical protein
MKSIHHLAHSLRGIVCIHNNFNIEIESSLSHSHSQYSLSIIIAKKTSHGCCFIDTFFFFLSFLHLRRKFLWNSSESERERENYAIYTFPIVFVVPLLLNKKIKCNKYHLALTVKMKLQVREDWCNVMGRSLE